MHKDEVARFVEKLSQEGCDGELIESVLIGGANGEMFSEN